MGETLPFSGQLDASWLGKRRFEGDQPDVESGYWKLMF